MSQEKTEEVSKKEQRDEPDYYDTWVMELQWKQPDGTTKPLVTIEVKDEVQRLENSTDRRY